MKEIRLEWDACDACSQLHRSCGECGSTVIHQCTLQKKGSMRQGHVCMDCGTYYVRGIKRGNAVLQHHRERQSVDVSNAFCFSITFVKLIDGRPVVCTVEQVGDVIVLLQHKDLWQAGRVKK